MRSDHGHNADNARRSAAWLETEPPFTGVLIYVSVANAIRRINLERHLLWGTLTQ